MKRLILYILYLFLETPFKCYGWSSNPFHRRDILNTLGSTIFITLSPTRISNAQDIFTNAYGKEEYTNSITASRDTNISPKEVYDSIQSYYVKYPLEQLKAKGLNREARAWDVGAGAGVSTQTLYNMGYTNIEAVDWSDTAVSINRPFGVTYKLHPSLERETDFSSTLTFFIFCSSSILHNSGMTI